MNWVAAARRYAGRAAERARALHREHERRCQVELRLDIPMWRG